LHGALHSPTDESSFYNEITNGNSADSPREDLSVNTVFLPIALSLICGLFSGVFTVALLFRRIAIALAITGPLLFSAVWLWWDWDTIQNKQFALGAFAVGFTLTSLPWTGSRENDSINNRKKLGVKQIDE
jgi:hypothetical protein